jgi:phosphopantothenoylcysteine decarboxylase/phosphopantothenate--cysteine ligase
MQRKCCDLMVSNEASAMDALDNQVEILDRSGQVLQSVSGSKQMVATAILDWIERRLIG